MDPSCSTSTPYSLPIQRRINALNQPVPVHIPRPASDEAPFLGPIPVQTFLDELVKERPGREIGGNIFRASTTLGGNASTGALMIAVSRLCSSLHHYGIQSSPNSTNFLSIPFVAKSSRPQDQDQLDLFRVESFAEVLRDGNDDPFSDKEDDFLTDSGKACRRNIVSYAEQIFGSQFRTHLFSFCTFGPFARIFYWDTTGVLVTERFNFVDTDFLAEFLWRFDGMTSEERGVDGSVRHLDDEWPTHLAPPHILERLRARDAYNPPDSHGRSSRRHRNFCLIKIPGKKAGTPKKKAKVPRKTSPRRRHVILVSSPPVFKRSPLFEKATRPMHGYDIRTSRMVFVKQYWREDGYNEGRVYAKLQREGVRNLPVFEGGDDVGSYRTRTQNYLNKPWCRASQEWHLPRRRLHRMVLSTIGIPLTEFQTTRELVGAIRDAMQCHDDAFFKARILHRDVSIWNIMIDPVTRKGMLIDWDVSSSVSEDGLCTDHDSAGTWRFMSAALLLDPQVEHTVVDDRESAVYVPIWTLLHYVEHNRYEQLYLFTQMFSERWQDLHNGRLIDFGGQDKTFFFLYPSFTSDITFEGGQSIAQLVRTLQKAFFHHYQRTPDRLGAHEEHEKAANDLQAQGCLVNILTTALDDPTWSDSPRVEPNYLDRQNEEERKREEEERAAREEDDSEEDEDGDDDEDGDEDEGEGENEDEDVPMSNNCAKRGADDREGKLSGDDDIWPVVSVRPFMVPRSMPARF